MVVDEADFKKALSQWYAVLDECNATKDKEFADVLNKYNLTLNDIGW